MRTDNVIDLAVIGAGPAGLAAAVEAKEAGLKNVTVIERAETPGGLLFQCIHNGFGLHQFNEDLTGPEYAHRYIQKATSLDIDFMFSTMVLDITPKKELLISNSTNGLLQLNPKAIVLAMGCRERTRQALMIHGTRPAGVFTAGTAQRYINVEGVMPGNNFVIMGSGDIGMIMARRLTLEGAQVKAVVEVLPYIGGLIRNEVQCINDFDIPLLLEQTVTYIHGTDRVEAVTISHVDKSWNALPGTEKILECDTLLLSVGLIPENELSAKAGIKLDPLTGGPIVNNMLETNVSGIFAAGNVLHVHDLVDNVSKEAGLAGKFASEYISGKFTSNQRSLTLNPGNNIRYILPQSISIDSDTTLYARVKEPAENVRLHVGRFKSKKLRAVRPSEMVQLKLSQKDISKIPKGTNEIKISCEKEDVKNAKSK